MSDPNNYIIGWICAIEPEFVAAQEPLDVEHDPPTHGSPRDNNSYALGRIKEHNVVIAVFPDGGYGNSSAAVVARDMLHSFPNIRVGLMVGVEGDAPIMDYNNDEQAKKDIRLGDFVESSPEDGSSGVFEYDSGKTIQNQKFQYTQHLDQPPPLVRSAVASLKAHYKRWSNNIRKMVEDVIIKNKRLRMYRRPGPSDDILYRSDFLHCQSGKPCKETCAIEPHNIVFQKTSDDEAGDDDPTVHYGLIAFANQLMKDATVRCQLAAEKGVLFLR